MLATPPSVVSLESKKSCNSPFEAALLISHSHREATRHPLWASAFELSEFSLNCSRSLSSPKLFVRFGADLPALAVMGARPRARTGHITPMGPIFSPSASFFCSSLNEA